MRLCRFVGGSSCQFLERVRARIGFGMALADDPRGGGEPLLNRLSIMTLGVVVTIAVSIPTAGAAPKKATLSATATQTGNCEVTETAT